MLPEGFQIRLSTPQDMDAAYEVCLQTGDSGKPAAHLYEDPKALGRIYVGPYLKLEPELSFLLEDAQGVCGYVLGALDSKSFYKRYVEEWLPDIRKQHPEPTGDPDKWTRTQQVYHDYYHPDLFCPEPYEEYPSHLHIDLMPRVQGRGLGKEMMNVLMKTLADKGSPGVHLGLGASNTRAAHFYKKLGFKELARVGNHSIYMGRHLP